MKLVIDIPDIYYSACKDWKTMGVATTAEAIIADGTPYEERPKGEWVHDSNGVYCSNCKSYYETITYWNGDIHVHNDIFCGHCGAKMIKEDDTNANKT